MKQTTCRSHKFMLHSFPHKQTAKCEEQDLSDRDLYIAITDITSN